MLDMRLLYEPFAWNLWLCNNIVRMTGLDATKTTTAAARGTSVVTMRWRP